MTALTDETTKKEQKWNRIQLPLKAGVKAWKGGLVLLHTDGIVLPAVTGATNASDKVLGLFAESVDNSGSTATTLVTIDFVKEKTIIFRAKSGTITAAMIGSPIYADDDNSATTVSTNRPLLGTLLAVDSVLGVGFEWEGV